MSDESLKDVPCISVTVAKKRAPRGRPRLYHPDHLAFAQQPTGWTSRAAQEKLQLGRAHRVLLPLLPRYPELSWLMSRPDAPYRMTILSALGRIRHDETLIIVAREVAQHHMKSRPAVAYIRRARSILEGRPLPRASVRRLAEALVATMADYADRFPDVTHAQQCEALERAWLSLSQK